MSKVVRSKIKPRPKQMHLLRVPSKDVYVAYSGGVDSAVLVNRLLKLNYTVTLLNVHHSDPSANEECLFATKTAKDLGVPCVVVYIPEFNKLNNPNTSREHYWSRERNAIFQSLDKPVLTGHHLDDAVEWYVMSTFTGTPKLLDFNNKNVYRPMLLIDKDVISQTADYFGVEHLTDTSNFDPTYNLRNKVRSEILPAAREAFPGLRKTVRRLIKNKIDKASNETVIGDYT